MAVKNGKNIIFDRIVIQADNFLAKDKVFLAWSPTLSLHFHKRKVLVGVDFGMHREHLEFLLTTVLNCAKGNF